MSEFKIGDRVNRDGEFGEIIEFDSSGMMAIVVIGKYKMHCVTANLSHAPRMCAKCFGTRINHELVFENNHTRNTVDHRRDRQGPEG